jgi:hypothetical protein
MVPTADHMSEAAFHSGPPPQAGATHTARPLGTIAEPADGDGPTRAHTEDGIIARPERALIGFYALLMARWTHTPPE